MEVLTTIALVFFGVVLILAILKNLFAPYTTFTNFFLEVIYLQWLFDAIQWVAESIIATIWGKD